MQSTEEISAQAQLAAIIDSSDDAILTKTLDGIITSWNAAAERIFGYSAQEAIGQPMTMLIPPDRIDEEPNILSRIGRGEKVDHFETVRIRKDKKPILISATISPLKNINGKIIGASKIARDITNVIEEIAAKVQLATIVDSSDDAILTKTLDGIITSWNAAAEFIFGYSAQEAVGQPMTMLIPPDRTDEEPNILFRIGRGEKVDHFETVRIRKDKKPIFISATISPLRDINGKIVGASKIARDITNVRELEVNPRSATYLRAIGELALVSIANLRGDITMINQKFSEVSGYSEEELVGQNHKILNSGVHPKAF